VVILDSETVRLTPTQYRLLALLVEHPGEALPRAALSVQARGDACGTSPRHVDFHIRGLRRKRGVYADHYIETVFGSPQEFVESGILRGLPDFLKSDVFGVGGGRAFCFQ
jgi:DNA-binding response OmpR family regulator